MTLDWIILLEVFLISISLAMDALAVSVTDGLCYRNLTKSKGITIPLTFGVFQAIMPLIGFFIAYVLGQAFSEIFKAIDHWIAFFLLFVIGGKMIIDAIKEARSKEESVQEKQFSYLEVLVQGIATSIDAFLVGATFALKDGINLPTILVIVIIIGVITFIISLTGLIFGKKVGDLFKNKAWITEIVGGLVLIGIGLKTLIEGLL